MTLLDRVLAMVKSPSPERNLKPPPEQGPTPTFVRLGGSPVPEPVRVIEVPQPGAERAAPLPTPAIPMIGYQPPGLPNIDPTPIAVMTPEASPPRPEAGIPPLDALLTATGVQVTDYDHTQLLQQYEVQHQVGRGPRPAGVERRPNV